MKLMPRWLRRVSAIMVLALVLAGTFKPVQAQAAFVPTITYRTSLQNSGWSAWKKNAATSGSTKGSARLEALQVRISRAAQKKGSVIYRVHIAGKGWQSWRPLGKTAGYVGKGKAIDAVRIRLKGSIADKYDIVYRVRVGGVGWLGWAKNGAKAGVTNGTANVGAIKIKLVLKGQAPASNNPYLDLSKTLYTKLEHYMTHSLCQLDYNKNFKSGGCCAMSYAIGISILTKKDVDPTSYYRKDWYSPSTYLCYYDDGHVGTYKKGFSAQTVYKNLRAKKPTMVHYTYSTGQHWVCVIGIKGGLDVNNLSYDDFIAIDPYSGKECALSECSLFSRSTYIATQPMV